MEDGEREQELAAKGVKGKSLEKAMAVPVLEAKAGRHKALTVPEDCAPSIWCDVMQGMERLQLDLIHAQKLFPGPTQLEFLSQGGGDARRMVLVMDDLIPRIRNWIGECELVLYGDLDDVWGSPALALKGQGIVKDILKFGSDAHEMQAHRIHRTHPQTDA